MTKETDQFRKNRVLTTLESLAVRLEVVVGYLERKVALDLAAEAPPEPPEAEKKAEEALAEEMADRWHKAQILAERVLNGEITEEEREEYMARWMR